MQLRLLSVCLVVFGCSLATAAPARRTKVDVYFGFSRVGANLYAANTDGMNGWQAAVNIKPFRLVGFEGDVSHYSQSAFSEQVTTVMVGPRITAPAGALSFFAHAMGGLAHQNATPAKWVYPYVDYNAVSYAFGGGGEIPVFRGWKFRVTCDYLGNSKAPTASDLGGIGPFHLRIGAGAAYHF